MRWSFSISAQPMSVTPARKGRAECREPALFRRALEVCPSGTERNVRGRPRLSCPFAAPQGKALASEIIELRVELDNCAGAKSSELVGLVILRAARPSPANTWFGELVAMLKAAFVWRLGTTLRLGCALLALVVCLPVTAQQPSLDWTRCVNEGKAFSRGVQISGCTAVLQSGRETTANRAIAYSNRGNAYRAKGDTDRAIADYTEAIRLNPSDAIAYYNRGVSYERKGDHNRAIADYRRALAIDPSLEGSSRTPR
jgi:tetratricopeptide (TPR) repeat protein